VTRAMSRNRRGCATPRFISSSARQKVN